MKNCKIYIILIFSFLLLSCENNKKSITSESSKINEYFESYFNDKVDRSPMYQTRLGIKKDYDKWDNISPEEDTLEIKIAKDALQWIKDSIDIEFLNDIYFQHLHLWDKT